MLPGRAYWLFVASSIGVAVAHNLTSTSHASSAATTSVPINSASASPTSTAKASATHSAGSAPARPKNPKRGLAFAAGDTPGDLNNANQTRSVISWQYDWSNSPPDYLLESNIEYVAMQWGSGDIENLMSKVQASGAKVVLGFNEPDFASESNIGPTEAAALWKQYMEPLKALGVRLGAPAVTASDTGKPWLTEFMAACDNCTIDFIPLHWYGSGVGGFFDYLGDIHGQFPTHPLWVTEFAETSTNDTVVADFLNQTIVYMDGLDWVERYAWFGYFRPKEGLHYNLLDAMGGLNTLGQIYTCATTVHTSAAPSPNDGYITVNGADDPTHVRVSVFPAATSAALPGFTQVGWNIVTLLGIVVGTIGLGLGTTWTL